MLFVVVGWSGQPSPGHLALGCNADIADRALGRRPPGSEHLEVDGRLPKLRWRVAHICPRGHSLPQHDLGRANVGHSPTARAPLRAGGPPFRSRSIARESEEPEGAPLFAFVAKGGKIPSSHLERPAQG